MKGSAPLGYRSLILERRVYEEWAVEDGEDETSKRESQHPLVFILVFYIAKTRKWVMMISYPANSFRVRRLLTFPVEDELLEKGEGGGSRVGGSSISSSTYHSLSCGGWHRLSFLCGTSSAVFFSSISSCCVVASQKKYIGKYFRLVIRKLFFFFVCVCVCV